MALDTFTKWTDKLDGIFANADISIDRKWGVRITESYSINNTMSNLTLENGTVVTDHVRTQPERVVISGVVGDEYIKLNPINTNLLETYTNVGRITSYLPTRTKAQIAKYAELQGRIFDAIAFVNNIERQGLAAADYFGITSGEDPKKMFVMEMASKARSRDFVQIEVLQSSRRTAQLIDAQRQTNHYALSFNKCIITDFSATVENGSGMLNYTMTLQVCRFATTMTTRISNALMYSDSVHSDALQPVIRRANLVSKSLTGLSVR